MSPEPGQFVVGILGKGYSEHALPLVVHLDRDARNRVRRSYRDWRVAQSPSDAKAHALAYMVRITASIGTMA